MKREIFMFNERDYEWNEYLEFTFIVKREQIQRFIDKILLGRYKKIGEPIRKYKQSANPYYSYYDIYKPITVYTFAKDLYNMFKRLGVHDTTLNFYPRRINYRYKVNYSKLEYPRRCRKEKPRYIVYRPYEEKENRWGLSEQAPYRHNGNVYIHHGKRGTTVYHKFTK